MARGPGYWTYLRSTLRFGWWWLPALLTGLLVSHRAGGIPRLALVLLVVTPACILLATLAEWRKVRRDAE